MVNTSLPTMADIVVIGGGPAGLAAALAARRRGLDVVVLDRRQPPIDKACGEGLMPDGIAALQEIGVEIDPHLGFRFRGIRFLDEKAVAEAAFPDETGLGIRRTALHQALMIHAEAAGVRVCWRVRVDGVDSSGVRANRKTLRCRWVVAADGLHSPIARALGLRPAWTGPQRFGLRQHFQVKPWTDFVEVYWQSGCQAYVTPIGPEEVCVALIGGTPPRRMSSLRDLFPQLASRLGDSKPSSVVRGGVSQSTKRVAVTRAQVALIGDASGSVDAVTGEGLAVAFRHAAVLADALASDGLARYEAAHRKVIRRPLLMARMLLMMDGRDELRRRALQALSDHPEAFRRFLALHIGALHPMRAALDMARLAFGLLTPPKDHRRTDEQLEPAPGHRNLRVCR